MCESAVNDSALASLAAECLNRSRPLLQEGVGGGGRREGGNDGQRENGGKELIYKEEERLL